MSIYLFTNNAITNLFADISSSATTFSVTTATGSIFPTITTGTTFKITMQNASDLLTNEIMLVTNRVGDVFTVVRGQEGTTAIDWAAGSIVTLLVTMGELENFVQTDQLQTGTYNYITGGGTANAITGTVDSNLTTIPDGFNFVLTATAANTGPAYLTLTMGSTLQSTHQIVKNGQVPLVAGDIPSANYPCHFIYVEAWGQFVMDNPTYAQSGSISGGNSNEILYQTAPGVTGFVTAPSVNNSFLGYTSGTIQWEALPTVTTAINLAGGTAYQVPYQSAANTTTFMPAPSVSGSLLSFTGSGFAWTTNVIANVLQTTNYKIYETGGKLYFQYQGTNIASLDSSGIFTVLNSLIAASTP